MPVTLHYHAPEWVDTILQGITAVPPVPLSLKSKILLSKLKGVDLSQYDGEERGWESLQALAFQPWAASWLSIEGYENVAEYAWMAIYPCHHSLHMRSTTQQIVELSVEQHTTWLSFLRQYLHEPEWRVAVIGQVAMVGLSLIRHPNVNSAEGIEHYPLWLRLKTELEMCLFERVKQGEDWGGANGICILGSGILPETFDDHWSAVKWRCWLSQNARWQALGKYYKVPKIASAWESEIVKEEGGAIWVDASQNTSELLELGIALWMQGKVARVELYSWLQTHQYIFELPDWPSWKRYLYSLRMQWDKRFAKQVETSFIKGVLG